MENEGYGRVASSWVDVEDRLPHREKSHATPRTIVTSENVGHRFQNLKQKSSYTWHACL